MPLLESLAALRRRLKAALWTRRGRAPNTSGAHPAKWLAIEAALRRTDGRYGFDDAGIDERIVEYSWLFDRMRELGPGAERVLDAGSVLNYAPVLRGWTDSGFPPVSIVTLKYEGHAEVSDGVRYEFGDLRQLPYRDEWFPVTLCLSTIEHVGLDNTIYGAAAEASVAPTPEALRALRELQRVTIRGGTVLLSVPFGARSNRGWFRIFDAQDLEPLMSMSGWSVVRARYFHATREGWRETTAENAQLAGYNEPPGRPGQRTAPPWVAGAEAVALIEMQRL